jgi:hypothetical protein
VGVSTAGAVVCGVCGVGARGEGAGPQDPLEVVEGRGRASMRV